MRNLLHAVLRPLSIVHCTLYFVLLVSCTPKADHLTILHTNDTHSQIEPKANGQGGYARRMGLIAEERKADPDLLLLDAGDFCQGTPYFNFYHGRVEIDAMNYIGYDAATLGNHEFDNGLDSLAMVLKLAQFPVVCANYDFAGTPLEGVVKPYVILKRKGVKIGVFGLSPELDGLVEKHNSEGVTYLDPVKKALEVATFLKEKKKCDFIICVSHLGWGTGPANDQAMIAGSRYIDLVLGGHSHTYFTQLEYVKNLDGQQVPVDQNGKHGIWIGKMTVDLKKK